MKALTLLLLFLPLFASAQTERQSIVIDKLISSTIDFNSRIQRLAEKDYPSEIRMLEMWLNDTGYNVDSIQDANLLPRLFADSAEMLIPMALLTEAEKIAFGVLAETKPRARIPLTLVKKNNGNYQVEAGAQNWRIDAGAADQFELKNFLGNHTTFLLTSREIDGSTVYSDRRSAIERGRYAEIRFHPRN